MRHIMYTIYRDGYVRHFLWHGCEGFTTFERARTMQQARKWARHMGPGAVIQRVCVERGRRRVKEWEYRG